MPRRYTVIELVAQCRKHCDQADDVDGAGPIDDDEWATLISRIYGQLYLVVAHSGMEYFEYTSTITSDGGFVYDEVSDHLSTVELTYVGPDGRRYDLEEVMAQERSRVTGRTGDRATLFALVDDKLYLYPTPPAGQTYELRYIPQPPDLALRNMDESPMVCDVVTPDGLTYVIEGVKVLAASKLEFDPALAMKERDDAYQRLEEWAALRAFNAPRRFVSDAEQHIDPDDWRWR